MQKENQTNKQKTAIELVLKRIKTDTDMMSIVHINEMFTSLGYCLRDEHILLHTQYLYIYVVKHWEKKNPYQSTIYYQLQQQGQFLWQISNSISGQYTQQKQPTTHKPFLLQTVRLTR